MHDFPGALARFWLDAAAHLTQAHRDGRHQHKSALLREAIVEW